MKQFWLILLTLSSSALAQSQSKSLPHRIDVKDTLTSFPDRIDYSCERPGVLIEVPELGDIVEPETIIVRLNDAVPQAVLKVAEARAESDIEIEVAKKSAEAAELEYDAALEANRYANTQHGAFTKTHIDRLKANFEAANLQTNQAEHEKVINGLTADQARAELATYHVTTDAGGVVTKVYKHKGEGVQTGEAVVQVVNTSRLRIEGNVSPADSFRIKPGMAVIAIVEFPIGNGTEEREYSGKLRFVDVNTSSVREGKVSISADIENNDGMLREGVTATMYVLLNEKVSTGPNLQ